MRLRPATVTALAVLALAGCGDEGGRTGTDAVVVDPPAPAPTTPTVEVEREPPPEPAPEVATAPRPWLGRGAVVRPRERVALRRAPAGEVVARVGPRTTFGSQRWMPVRRRHGGWIGVIAAERPNGRLGWLRLRAVEVRRATVRIDVDLSERLLVLRRGGRALLRMAVGVGGPGTPTPTGEFAVTDGLGAPPGSPYGCCILALSGHQPNVPQGWTGGDRIAVHGTRAPATIGAAASAGCLRASDANLRRLLALAQLGSLVRIRA